MGLLRLEGLEFENKLCFGLKFDRMKCQVSGCISSCLLQPTEEEMFCCRNKYIKLLMQRCFLDEDAYIFFGSYLIQTARIKRKGEKKKAKKEEKKEKEFGK